MNFSKKLIKFLNNNKTCMVSLKNEYNNPYPLYTYEKGSFFETTTTHYPRISGVSIEVVYRKYADYNFHVVHSIKVETYGMNHWANECPTVYNRRERILNFLYNEIKRVN